MMPPAPLDQEIADLGRSRHSVQLAAKSTKIHQAKRWLFEDERGALEQMAKRLLELSVPQAVKLRMTRAAVDKAISVELVLSALEALEGRAK